MADKITLPPDVEAQAYLASIIASSDDAIISNDLKGNITSWNPAAERIFGYIEDEIVGKHISILLPPQHAEEAAKFYAKTFPDSKVTGVHKAPNDYPGGKKGQVLTVEFTVLGIPCLGLNGGPVFPQSEAFSFQVITEDQAETDKYWNALVGNGGAESQCGWCKDKWGLSWQITPRVLMEGTTDPDPVVAKRVFDAMMTMQKIDVAKIEAARRG